MRSNIIPRYSKNQVTNYTSTDFISTHQPQILADSAPPPENALIQNFNQISIQDKQALLAIEDKEQMLIQQFGGPSGEMQNEGREVFDQERKMKSTNLELTGHEDQVLALDFSNDGNYLLSAGLDRQILLWDIYNQCINIGVNRETKKGVISVKFSGDSEKIFAAGADHFLHAIDSESMVRFKKFKGHSEMLTCVDSTRTGVDKILTSSNDATLKLWDLREKNSVHTQKEKYPILACAFLPRDSRIFFSGGIENLIKKWDLRQPKTPLLQLTGHTDTVSSIRVDIEGKTLLSNSMDNTVRTWNIQPFCISDNRCLKVYQGHAHGYDIGIMRADWSRDKKYVASGSASSKVIMWNAASRKIKVEFGGHVGPVNDVKFSPSNDIIASCSNDRKVYLTDVKDFLAGSALPIGNQQF